MTHLEWFKFLLLLTFAVWMHQCTAFSGIDSKATVLKDCCLFGRNRSKKSCDGSSFDFHSIPNDFRVECKSKIKYCCRKKREIEDCNEGVLAAQNGSTCPSISNKYTICHKACLLGVRMAEKGDDCNKPTKGEELLEINARRTCCIAKREELLLSDDDETNEAIGEEDEYGDDENDTFFDATSPGPEETPPSEQTTNSEPAKTTQQTTSTTEFTTTNKEIDYDEATASYSTTTIYPITTNSLQETAAKFGSFWISRTTPVQTNSLETNEIDTQTTTRRFPPKYRHPTITNKDSSSSSEEKAITRSPSSEIKQLYIYEYPKLSDNHTKPLMFYNFTFKYPVPFDLTKFLASRRNIGNNPEPCGDIRYCDHSCIVMQDVQKCSCNKGYILQNDGKTCLLDGSRIPPEEITKKRCQSGHFLNDFGDCQDIDECKIQNNGCGDKAICRNVIGSYECIPTDICKAGYRYNDSSKSCEDINECSEYPRVCEYEQVCNNTLGSYICEDSFSEFKARCEELVTTTLPTTTTTTQDPCHRGFQRNYKGICVDIDECLFNPCDQGLICVNRNGGYTCEVSHCNPGFKPVGRTCEDINECDSNPCPLTHNCLNTHGSYACKMKMCTRGYRLDRTGGCEDINECHIYKNLCRNADCINTNGSFLCNCNDGYRKDENNYCRDINECTENIHDCNHRCVNTFGGYQCYCEKGYRLNSDKKTCDDIDECRENGYLLCQGECVNTLGSYECRCPSGFRKEESYCIDIDECQEYPGACDKKISQCLNIPGSYKCMDIRCTDGYKLVRRNGERFCHLRTPCGDDDYEDDCNKPWMYSYSFASRIANCSASKIFHVGIANKFRYDVVIEDVRAYSPKDTVKKAGFDSFIIQTNSSGFFLASIQPIDGPQDIDIDVLVTYHRPDGSVEHKRGVKVKLVVSEFSFYKFSVRK
ncbi:unnamed protein product [Chironomus riparius]|uniref:EGF-like domain-containing protein n=1 Tax=Chironomus riparius TaxID=315576 RepID=A0A9N9S720_9DIPT|nr:unnamed protein product [Chironomus riparius]